MAADNLASLLAHADWLRDLARKLVSGAAADDAVQDTYIAALRSPPDPELPAKPWLERVLRNASRMAHRGATRRARREDAATQIAVPPSSVADTVARAETFRMLVELELALDDPHRTTILRHYFDGESFAPIARRDGIPEATIRGRHRQSLEQLRRRFDARSHGDRGAWLASLAPIAARPAHTAFITPGVVLAKKLVVIAVVAVLPSSPSRRPRRQRGLALTLVSAHASERCDVEPEHPHAHLRGSDRGCAAPTATLRQLASADRTSRARRAHRRRASRSGGAGPASSVARPRHCGRLGKPRSSSRGGPGQGRDPRRDARSVAVPFTLLRQRSRDDSLRHHIEVRAHFTLIGDPDRHESALRRPQARAAQQARRLHRVTLQTLELPPLGDGEMIEFD